MNHLKKIAKWIVNILTCILLVILALVIYGKCVLLFTNSQYPSYFGYTLFEIASGSMEPALYKSDVIIVKIDKDDFAKNDIIAFLGDDTVITHRVLFIDNDVITVKGDNNNTMDAPIKRDQVIGKVVKILPKFGIWKKVIMEPKILVLIFVTLLLFDFTLSYKFNPKEEVEEKKPKKEEEEEVKTKKPTKKVLDVDIPTKPVISVKDEYRIEKEKLLELTRKIDIVEVNKLLDSDIRLTDEEAKNLKKSIKEMDFEEPLPKLKKKEQKFLEYTMRLDLSEIQKHINSKVK